MSNTHKHRDTNTSELERYILELEEKERKSRRDTGLLALLIVVGLIGLTYVLRNPQKATGNDVITFGETIKEDIPVNQPPTVKKPIIKPLVLHINGEKEVKEVLQFVIEGFDERVNYTIDYGDGAIVKAQKKNTHSYLLSGKFTVKLYSNFNGKSKILHNQQILINSAIEVGQDALRDID